MIRSSLLALFCLCACYDMRAANDANISISDLARFASIGDPNTLGWGVLGEWVKVAAYSPDGKHAAVLVRSGNVTADANEAQLLIFDTQQWSTAPRIVARAASRTNFQPMAYVRWLADNRTVVYAGSEGDALPQVFSVDTHTGVKTQLTQNQTPLNTYHIDADGKWLVTSTEGEAKSPPEQRSDCAGPGCLVVGGNQFDFVGGAEPGSQRITFADLQSGRKNVLPRPQDTDPSIRDCMPELDSVSPDGRFAFRRCMLRHIPAWWRDYTADWRIRDLIDDGNPDNAQTLVVYDLRTGAVYRVNDAPYFILTVPPIWIDGGRVSLLSGVVESLSGVTAQERERRLRQQAILMFEPGTGRTTTVASIDAVGEAVTSAVWDARDQTLILHWENKKYQPIRTMAFKRRGSHWIQVARAADIEKSERLRDRSSGELVIEQSSNHAPKLYVQGGRAATRRMLLDPNPWLEKKHLGRIEPREWNAKDGRRWTGALLYPPDYVPGTRYPLLIQTHHFEPEYFSLHVKSHTRNFPGQAMAAQGVFVLQVHENERGVSNHPEWWSAMQAGYEGAIDALAEAGLIDAKHVGILGWSFTGTTVAYTLTHSSYRFAAAALMGTDAGSWSAYMMVGGNEELDLKYGARPFGAGLDAWKKYSPVFNLDRVSAPVFLWGERSLVGVWDWHAGLDMLGKPNELWLATDVTHDAFKIHHQLSLNQKLLDWFVFWLKGAERADPADYLGETRETLRAQYARWERLRVQEQEAVHKLTDASAH